MPSIGRAFRIAQLRAADGGARVLDGLSARRGALRAPGQVTGRPDPGAVGSYHRGRQILDGVLPVTGLLLPFSASPWEVAEAPGTPPAARAALHAFDWLDDLAAVGDRAARALARQALADWLARFGSGQGEGWRPETTGRRVRHWLAHLDLICDVPPDPGADGAATARDRALCRSLARQMHHLGRRWHGAPAGLGRFEALTGLMMAGLALEGGQAAQLRAQALIGEECTRTMDADGGIASRDPEELAAIFALLVAGAMALDEAGARPDARHGAAIERLAPTLRTLRFADGSLARFHGGGPGREGRLDRALAGARIRRRARDDFAMGYLRMAGGRTALVLDAARPPRGDAAARAHASTLAFEMASGPQPVLVSTGPGSGRGPGWDAAPARSCRENAAHCALVLGGQSSARIGPDGWLADGPGRVGAARAEDETGHWILASHDGYVPGFGLTHERRLFLSADGTDFRGEDTLSAEDPAARRRFDRAVGRVAGRAVDDGIGFEVIFHLHPDVTPLHDARDGTLSLLLPGGERWDFVQSGGQLRLAGSVWRDPAQGAERGTKQVVVSARAVEYGGRVTWAFRRAAAGAGSDGTGRAG